MVAPAAAKATIVSPDDILAKGEYWRLATHRPPGRPMLHARCDGEEGYGQKAMGARTAGHP